MILMRRLTSNLLQHTIIIIVVLLLTVRVGGNAASSSKPIYTKKNELLLLLLPQPKASSIVHSLRGGTTKRSTLASTTHRSKQKKKITNRSKKKQPRQSGLQKKNQNQGDDGDPLVQQPQQSQQQQQQQQQLPTIKAILIPRRLSIAFLIRTVSFAVCCISIFFCSKTAGLPYARAVWTLVHGTASAPSIVTPTATIVDEILAQRMAQSKNEILPPKWLPSPLPLVGVLTSLALWVCLTVLFPRWFVPVRVFLNYTRWNDVPITTTTTTMRNSLLSETGTSVLVHVPREQRDFESDGKPTVIRPLHRIVGRVSSHAAAAGKDKHRKSMLAAATHAHPFPFYFDLNHRRIYCDLLSQQQNNGDVLLVDGGPTLHTRTPIRDLVSSKTTTSSGLCTPSRLQMATERFGPYASLSLPTPTVQSAFLERISSPLVALQILGRLLSALEEDLFASLTNLFMTLMQHYWNARQSIISAGELAQEVKGNVEDTAAMKVWAIRPKPQKQQPRRQKKKNKNKKKQNQPENKAHEVTEWVEIPAVDLLPGDVFVLGSSSLATTSHDRKAGATTSGRDSDIVMPVDALLLEGSCVTNEAVLTGESVPQSKTPLDIDLVGENSSATLDMTSEHRNSILFAGTSLLFCTNQDGTTSMEEASSHHPPFPESLMSQDDATGRAKFLALRTGSYSSRGELVRALVKSGGHVGAISNPQSERDAIRLVMSLSLFALVACASLFVPMSSSLPSNPTVEQRMETSPFRRIIQCTRIAVASIPSDIPLSLSAVAQSCSSKLRKDADVVCSEPGSLLTAAHVDVVVLDKTGTLTADTQSLAYVVPSPGHAQPHNMTEAVLAGCHSLICLDEDGSDQAVATRGMRLVGDPLDLASLKYTDWAYNITEDCYVKSAMTSDGKSGTTRPIKLWQLKTFPFDPNRRMSSAVILVLHPDKKYRIWKVVKGSPDAMQRIVHGGGSENHTFDSWYEKKNHKLGAEGLRTIALAAEDVTDDASFVELLFPNGDIPDQQSSDHDLHDTISRARRAARNLHRGKIECFDDSISNARSLDFVGFACFDASIRPSTQRVIRELRRAEVNVMMLTGDGVDAAISVGRKAGLIESGTISVLDVENGIDQETTFVWRVMKLPSKKKRKRDHCVQTTKTRAFTLKSLKQILVQVDSGECALVATGNAIEALLLKNANDSVGRLSAYNHLRDNLSQVAVIASASPKVKCSVVNCLKEQCGKTVLMCGDGVNDVAAMKAANVAVALLNGYGDESITTEIGQDVEDQRRRQKLKQMRIGSNRRSARLNHPSQRDELADAGIGDSPAASRARVRARIHEASLDIKQRNKGKSVGFGDMKAMVTAIWKAVKEERDRAKRLRKGGGAAARILSEEDRLRKSIVKKTGNSAEHNGESRDDGTSVSVIKPGEASLAAAFSCLRPAIDGVDALMRAGIAAASCCIATQQSIALNCLMSCYNLATLYRDGFRYGKRMWNFELFLLMSLNSASYASSCTPRPRLAIRSRPPESMFDPSSIFSICTQAAIHLTTLTAGVNMANSLESIYSTLQPKKPPKIRWKVPGVTFASPASPLVTLATGLANLSSSHESEERSKEGFNLFGRPPFRPNYATNVVFLLSIFQNAVSAIVNHKGKPFCGSIHENRQMCISVGACLLFVFACVTEMSPQLNAFLELRPLPAKGARLRILALFLIDLAGCYLAEWTCSDFLDGERDLRQDEQRSRASSKYGTAADEEESLLAEESKENKTMLIGVLQVLLLGVVLQFIRRS